MLIPLWSWLALKVIQHFPLSVESLATEPSYGNFSHAQPPHLGHQSRSEHQSCGPPAFKVSVCVLLSPPRPPRKSKSTQRRTTPDNTDLRCLPPCSRWQSMQHSATWLLLPRLATQLNWPVLFSSLLTQLGNDLQYWTSHPVCVTASLPAHTICDSSSNWQLTIRV